MLKKVNILLAILFLTVGYSEQSKASHLLGGEIVWDCLGNGDYVFELIIYRDCNGFDVTTGNQILEVWGHPTISEIDVNFIDREDLSPVCTSASGNVPLECGSGSSSGTGPGAVERVIYRSDPVTLTGTPPQSGWTFSFKDFSRNGALTNLEDPLTYGLSLASTMYPLPNSDNDVCNDRSPRFLQDPYFVSCSGQDYQYSPHAFDPDLDSLVFSWAEPLNDFTGNFNPPNNPAPVPFEPGFSYQNPTPDNSFDPNNEAAELNTENGELTFVSNTLGNFAVKIQVDAYRNGQIIATVERETQLIVESCQGNNTMPTVAPPFGASGFETTINAGDVVNFTIESTDVESLQDGSPQSNIITVTGGIFGNNFTDPTAGCDITPCATLSTEPPVVDVHGASVDFNWQTSCDHLIGRDGDLLDEVPYTFVFKIQDDFCPVPKVRYETVTVYVQNLDVLDATSIDCIQTDENDDVTIEWEGVNDPTNVFEAYEVHKLGEGVIATINDINTTSYTDANAGNQANSYFISTLSGCDGIVESFSDTIQNIFLEVNNPNNGTAILDWNSPKQDPEAHYGDYYHVYRQLPQGNWQLIDSVPYGLTNYRDTIRICEGFIDYRIHLPTSKCDFISNIDGDDFEDMLTPSIPEIYSVSVDSTTGNVVVNWNENNQPDTYGYVIYTLDAQGFLVELDTIWGLENTTYIHDIEVEEPLTYSVAAFDSCFTDIVPPTYQTSAKSDIHVSMFLESGLNVCNREIEMSWTEYEGFDTPSEYEVWGIKNETTWELLGTTSQNDFNWDISFGDEYRILVKLKDESKDTSALSNIVEVSFEEGSGPTYAFLAYASVTGEDVEILQRLTLDGGVTKVILEKYDENFDEFEDIDSLEVTNSQEVYFIDEDTNPNRETYTYRTILIDTCDQVIGISNIGRTILAKIQTNEDEMTHTIQWTPYDRFLGNVIEYRIFRGIDGNFDNTPFATTNPNIRTVTDNVANFIDDHEGRICYRVEAVEGQNPAGIRGVSRSNVVCSTLDPLIYIPNAFTVGGKNPVFKPETRMHRFENYRFEIYDRFGRVIFETNDPSEGWDGSIHNGSEVAREGVYVYRLSLRDGDGIEVLKHGHVTLLDYRNAH